MAQSESHYVCSKCAREGNNEVKYKSRRDCPEGGDHDWSADDPLARLEARVEGDSMFHLSNSEDNSDWQWVEVRIVDHDVVGSSEILADLAENEGFSFNGLGDPGYDGDSPVVRFNRQK